MVKDCQNIKVSVIVTVHNSEAFLEESLNSACKQSLKEIEILCIDGGSKDASPEILKQFAERDSRIKIINDSNTSYGHKINVGIVQARGRYIGILETDDIMETDMLENLFEVAEKYVPDYIDGDYYQFFNLDDEKIRYSVKKYSEGGYYGHLIKDEDNLMALKQNVSAIWTGIYRRSYLLQQDIRLNESPGAAYQDTSFRFLVAALARKSYHIAYPVYNYRIDNSASSVKDMSKIHVIVNEYSYLKDELQRHGIKSPAIWELYYIRKYDGYYWNTLRLSAEGRKAFMEEYRREAEYDIQNGNIDIECLERGDYIHIAMFLKDPERFKEQVETDSRKRKSYLDNIAGIIRVIGNKDIIIFGCGFRGRCVYQILEAKKHQIQCFCDNNEAFYGETVCGQSIVSPESAVRRFRNAVYIIAMKDGIPEVKNQLYGLGVDEQQIVVFNQA